MPSPKPEEIQFSGQPLGDTPRARLNSLLNHLRFRRALSQETVGRMVGLNAAYLSRMRRGKQPVTRNLAALLHVHFGVRPEWLIGGTGAPWNHPDGPRAPGPLMPGLAARLSAVERRLEAAETVYHIGGPAPAGLDALLPADLRDRLETLERATFPGPVGPYAAGSIALIDPGLTERSDLEGRLVCAENSAGERIYGWLRAGDRLDDTPGAHSPRRQGRRITRLIGAVVWIGAAIP